MPNRPKAHQVEDASKAQFSLILPSQWIYRDKQKDYGLDGEVEIFDGNNNSTGLLFYVQLKATSSNKRVEKQRVSLKIDTIKYFNSLSIPVLIVRWVEKYDMFYVRWASLIDLFYAKEGAKTFSFILDKSDKWGKNTSSNIEKDIRQWNYMRSPSFSLPITCCITSNITTIKDILLPIISSTFREIIQGKTNLLNLIRKDAKPLATIEIRDNNTIVINFGIILGCTLHIKDISIQQNFVKEIILGLILSFASLPDTFLD